MQLASIPARHRLGLFLGLLTTITAALVPVVLLWFVATKPLDGTSGCDVPMRSRTSAAMW